MKKYNIEDEDTLHTDPTKRLSKCQFRIFLYSAKGVSKKDIAAIKHMSLGWVKVEMVKIQAILDDELSSKNKLEEWKYFGLGWQIGIFTK